ncbi:SGNH/GDSL hydrolase family protein [Nocardia sp. BSTN01]|uniref:SGNH/GDSL hydrolase family protein n=1 Tax=Nocardia sp. BSTN01 TaxID=2783665 RepID=UPI00188FA780|nr:SGNH/GDSL hydrolase family protein [Nocardia sp. BSTN01]MBF5002410.1 SGNH/GDSL hydrolase family protein [Nocardia sp. BSTN01]
MSFIKKIWQPKPSTATPINATELNRIEDGIDALYGPLVTRTLSYTNGGLGGSVTPTGNPWASGTAASWRYVVKLPEATNWWRIKIRNYDTPAAATKTALTGKKILFGTHARSSGTGTAGETGTFAGSTATTVVGSDFAIPGDSSYYTSPKVTAAGDQFQPGVEHLLAIGATAASSLAVQSGAGRAWYWSNATSGVDPTIAGSAATNQTAWIPLDWVIEYETTSRRRAYLVVGDSITEGIAGPRGTTSQTPTALWRSYPWQWAAANNALVTNMSIAGITAVYFAGSSAAAWSRLDHSAAFYDGAIIALGSNDINANRTLAQLQADILSTITNVRTIIGSTAPIYIGNVIARSLGTTPEGVRLDFNSWLAERPTALLNGGLIDFDAATRGTTTTALWPAYTADTIHPSWAGQARLAEALKLAMP